MFLFGKKDLSCLYLFVVDMLVAVIFFRKSIGVADNPCRYLEFLRISASALFKSDVQISK